MNKALLTVLVIVLVAGVFVEQGDAILRAGRDRIEKMERDSEMQQKREQAATLDELPYCIIPGSADKKK
ncbi:hypothetical protein OS493_022249 [Desmophyllum pertusum]|uniref:Uncharacterized protein n=1 Tax=Desmophyllum pertusum TaxID=174260 RepID=A0A9W9YAS6_9CNID|nr:hypothetical protein OS493_022249 [Desmophyllum pertusum]